MDIGYRITEYASVLCGYAFLMFLWPSVVFRKYLRGRKICCRFAFCTIIQIVIVNMLIHGLGFFHGLNRFAVNGFFYGVFLIMLLYDVGHFFSRMAEKASDRKTDLMYCVRMYFKEAFWNLADKGKRRISEYLLLAALVLFGMIYFSYTVFQTQSYGSGEVYAQHVLVNGLLEGKFFSEGIRPEAMHCFAACMNMLFHIPVYSILLYLQCIHAAVFMLAAYFLLREIFHWRYTPLLVLAAYLVWDVKGADLICAMARMQWTLPTEFGSYTIFLGALFLIRYLNKDSGGRKEDLSLFALALAAAVSIDFYTAVMIILICVPFAVYKGRKMVRREYFFPFLAGFFFGCLIGAAPMIAAYLTGIPVQEAWNGIADAAGSGGALYKGMRTLREGLQGIYVYGYIGLYGSEGAGWIRRASWLAVFLGVVGMVWKKKPFHGIGDHYIPTVLASVLFVLTYAMPYIGLAAFIPGTLIGSVMHMLVLAVLLIPADAAFCAGAVYSKDERVRKASVCSVAGICGAAVVTGHYHGSLYCEIYRLEAAATVTDSILESFPENSYVIVAPTDERYPVLGRGWHEELVHFIEQCEEADYMLPQEYIFLYVEKKPLLYAQTYFPDGPAWLAGENYRERYWEKYSGKNPYGDISRNGHIITGEISEEAAGKDLPLSDKADQWELYTRLENRTVLESKVYEWCQRFMQRYPYEMNVYYEDDDFVCYYLVQDLQDPYRLGWN